MILYSIYRNAAGFLLTEDKEIHKKAFNLDMGDRVLSINDALKIFVYKRYPSHPSSIKEKKVYNLDINDEIFDTLKEEYEEFEEWFEKISREGRDCLVYYEPDGSMGAILIYKIENEPIDVGKVLPAKKRLKIATLKVSSIGNKIGELFMRISVDYSIIHDLQEIYLTHFSQSSDYLVDLIEEYGFLNVGKNSRGEEVFIKELFPDAAKLQKVDPVTISKYYYPNFYDGEKIKKYIVPIIPEYHDRLFSGQERQSSLQEFFNEFVIEGNTIKKAYLSHSNIKQILPGDILIFYRSQSNQSATCLGVVDKVFTDLNTATDILELVGKRTVYSKTEINTMAKKTTLVILFTLSAYLPTQLSINKLKELKIIKAAPQTIQRIKHDKYLILKKESAIDERFTFN